MSNRIKGLTTFEALGETWTLSFPIDSLIALEDHFDLSIQEVGQLLGDGMRLSHLKAFFWAGLLAAHPGIDQARAAGVIDELGLPRAAPMLVSAFRAAFAAPEKAETARPRKAARAGTGKPS